jgi:predicted transcriptional regulator
MERLILISVRPEWVEKILNKEKLYEIRKSIPKCKLPCKVYIYCTKGKPLTSFGVKSDGFVFEKLNGKVVAEFTLNTIDYLVDVGGGVHYTDKDYNFLDLDNLRTNSCLTDEQIYQYLGLKKDSKYYNDGYVWHIDNLKIYDKPKELREFGQRCDYASEIHCRDCLIRESWNDCCKVMIKPLNRPPQSWCYVEAL